MYIQVPANQINNSLHMPDQLHYELDYNLFLKVIHFNNFKVGKRKAMKKTIN